MSTLVAKAETLAVDVSCSRDALSVALSDGRIASVPLVWFPRLADASSRERSDWELIGGGIGIHWEAIDENISVARLLEARELHAASREAGATDGPKEASRLNAIPSARAASSSPTFRLIH
jgi:hypothetical protein